MTVKRAFADAIPSPQTDSPHAFIGHRGINGPRGGLTMTIMTGYCLLSMLQVTGPKIGDDSMKLGDYDVDELELFLLTGLGLAIGIGETFVGWFKLTLI